MEKYKKALEHLNKKISKENTITVILGRSVHKENQKRRITREKIEISRCPNI